MTPASEIIFAIGLLLGCALGKALAHLFPIDGIGPQDNGTIQYKKNLTRLSLTVVA